MTAHVQQYIFSYLVRLFPAVPHDEFADFVDNVRENGLIDAIVVWRGAIVDGWHRYLACLAAGVAPKFTYLPNDADPLVFVVAKNLMRRHLTTSQRAEIAYRISALSARGRPRGEEKDGEVPRRSYTQAEAAKLLRVSRREVGYAAKVFSPDSPVDPQVRRAVQQGTLRVSDGARVADDPPEVQREALARVVAKKHRTIASAAGQVKNEIALRENEEARESIRARPAGETVTLHHSAVTGLHELVAAASVDVIFTHPPGTDEALRLFSDLASFADHSLKPGGVLVVMAHAPLLPRIIERLSRQELKWVLEFDVQFPGAQGRSGYPYRVNLHRRPLLVYAKPGFSLNGGSDVIAVPAPGELSDDRSAWHPVEVAMAMTVERFTQPGQVVCDPLMLGRPGSMLGAMENGCIFIGADWDRSCINRTREVLLQSQKQDSPETEGSSGAPHPGASGGPASRGNV